MASELNTQDLRSPAQDYKRDADSAHKWEHGESHGPGRLESAHGRPAKVIPLHQRTVKREKNREHNHAKAANRRDMIAERYATTDSSADEDVEAAPGPEPDADVAYSFDADRGPSNGSRILGVAVEKAMERYENNATEKLLKDEYLILDSEGEAMLSKKPKQGAKPSEDVAQEDFEFVFV